LCFDNKWEKISGETNFVICNRLFISKIILLDFIIKNLNYIIKTNLEKIFFILIKKFNSKILILIDYFKYKLNKYINFIYLYIEINFKYIKKI
jgi:hypothetical protein